VRIYANEDRRLPPSCCSNVQRTVDGLTCPGQGDRRDIRFQVKEILDTCDPHAILKPTVTKVPEGSAAAPCSAFRDSPFKVPCQVPSAFRVRWTFV